MKSVLMSIRPKWCELIASGKKTIEVRKTKPKIEMPFKVYIYCTKPSKAHQTICGCMCINTDELYRLPNNEIKYGSSVELMCCNEEYSKDNFLNGKVIGEFVCDNIELVPYYPSAIGRARQEKDSCLTPDEIALYLRDKNGYSMDGYAWHISNLIIYDKPKELKEFYRVDKPIICGAEMCEICNHYNYMRVNADEFDYDCDCDRLLENKIPITRPPQSYCYCEELTDNG